jgi:hypothetical protein
VGKRPTLRRTTLRAAGSVAALAGAHQVATGVRGVRAARGAVDPNVDSELRFYAGWYAVAGLTMLVAAARPDVDRSLRPLLELGWLSAVGSRLLSTRSAGRPDPLFVGLAALEAGVAIALLASSPERPLSE